MELHLYRPGEREYVGVYDVIERDEKKIILRHKKHPHPAFPMVIIKPVNPDGNVYDIDVPQKVKVFLGEHDAVPAIGYLRIFGDVIDIVVVE